MHLKCLMHALSVIGLVLLFPMGCSNPLPSLSLAQPTYLRLEIMMDAGVHRWAARIPYQAAVRWETIATHPSLPGDRARIALAALLYGRILFAHEETRVELFRRVGLAAKGLAEGDTAFKVEKWDLRAEGVSFPIWPWQLVGPGEINSPKSYVARLTGTYFPGILLDMTSGLERILAPASTLITLFALSQELNRDDRILLGQVLLAMNGYYRTPETASQLGSEMAALRAALPLLLPAAGVPPEKRERIVNKEDTDRIFTFNKAQWNAYAKEIGLPQEWTIRTTPFDTGTLVGAFDPKTEFGLAVQPLYPDDTGPPVMLIVSSYYPAGTLVFTESLKREFDQAARLDLGAGYDVSVSFQRFSPFGKVVDVVEIMITRANK